MVATKFETALVLKGDPNDHSQLKNIQDEHPLSMPMGGSCLIIEDVSPGKKLPQIMFLNEPLNHHNL